MCHLGRTFLHLMLDVLCKAHHPTLSPSMESRLPQGRLAFGGEISFHPGRVVASSMTTNGPPITFWSLHRRMPVWLRCLFRRRPALRVTPRPRRPLYRSVMFKELFTITAAVYTWAASFACRNILLHCDILPVVHILSRGTSKCKHVMTLLRFLFCTCAHHNILLRGIHIDGVNNHWADGSGGSRPSEEGGPGHPETETETVSKIFFQASVWSKIKEGGGTPGSFTGSSTGRSLSFSGRQVPCRLSLGFPFSNACKTSPLVQL